MFISLEKVPEPSLKSLGSTVPSQTDRSSGPPTRTTSRARRVAVSEEPRRTSKQLKTPVCHESITRRTLDNSVARGRAVRRTIAAHLQSDKDHMEEPERYWNRVLWTDETKLELSGVNKNRSV